MTMDQSRSFPRYSSSYSGFEEDRSKPYTFNGPSHTGDGIATASHSEMKRKKRIAAYNTFATEGKLKSSMRESFKWIKNKFTDVR